MNKKAIYIAVILTALSFLLIACGNGDNGSGNPSDGIPPWVGSRPNIESFNDYFASNFQSILPRYDGWVKADSIGALYQYYGELNAPKVYRGKDKLYQAYELCVVYPNPQNNLEYYGLAENTFSSLNADYTLSKIIISPNWSTTVRNTGNTTVVYDAYTDTMANYSNPYPRIFNYLKNNEMGLEPKTAGTFKVGETQINVSMFTYSNSTKNFDGDYFNGFREAMEVEEFYYTTYISIAELRIAEINYMIAMPVITVFHKLSADISDYIDKLNAAYGKLEYGSNEYHQAVNSTDKILDDKSFLALKNIAIMLQTKLVTDFLQ